MAYSIANNQLLRKHFARIKQIIDIPNLIDIQKNSYKALRLTRDMSYWWKAISDSSIILIVIMIIWR